MQSADLLAELDQDFGDELERRNLCFIKLWHLICREMEDHGPVILQVIQSGNTRRRQNVLELIKLVVTLQYMKFDSEFCFEMFRVLVLECINVDDITKQFEIMCFMLMHEAVQGKYFWELCENFAIETPEKANFSFKILKYLLKYSIELLEGKIKGPPVDKSTYKLFYEKSMMLLDIRLGNVSYPEDYYHLLEIMKYSLELKRKFGSEDMLLSVKIYMKMLENHLAIEDPTQFNEQIMDSLFGVIVELFTIPNNQQLKTFFEQTLHLQSLISYSRYFALKCENINKFWKLYLSKRKNNLNYEQIDSYSIVSYCFEALKIMTFNLLQIEEKFAIVDNIILATNLTTKMWQYQQFLRKEGADNPEHQMAPSLTKLALSALYSPLFKIDSSKSVLGEFTELLKGLAKANARVREMEKYRLQLLNLVPFIKIIIIKNRKVLVKEDFIETLLQFLFTFVGSERDKYCIEKFIFFLWDHIDELMKDRQAISIDRAHKMVMNSLVCLHGLIFKKEQKYLQGTPSHLKCLEKMIDVMYKQSSAHTRDYLSKLIEIMEYKSKNPDQSLLRLMSKLIKQLENDENQNLCILQKLFDIIFKSQKSFYLSLVFDLAQNNSRRKRICEQMQKYTGQIESLCFNSPMQDLIFRRISYQIMLQALGRNEDKAGEVIAQIAHLLNQTNFEPYNYCRIYELVQQQYQVLRNCNTRDPKAQLLVEKLACLPIKMINKINQSVEENVSLSNQQKSLLVRLLSFELLKICMLLQRNHAKAGSSPECLDLILEIKSSVKYSKLGLIPANEEAIKLLVTCYLLLETSLNMEFIKQYMEEEDVKEKKFIERVMINQNVTPEKFEERGVKIEDILLSQCFILKYKCMQPLVPGV